MSLFEKLDREQLTLLNRAIYPRAPEAYDLETLQVTDMIVENMISPFASHVIDRVAGWLEGEEKTLLKKARLPWQGDDQVAVERVSPINGVVASVITERAIGRAWRLNWKDEHGTPVVTVENREADGSFRLIARAKARHAQPRSMRDVNGWLRRDGLDSLIELSMLMASKMPKNFRSDWIGSLQRQDRAELPLIRDLLAADGGMPGPVSRAYLSIMHSIMFDGHAKWAYSRIDELVTHLDKMGAVWGEAVMEYGYDSSCTVPTSDGSVALFHDNSSTCGDERSYVAKFERGVDGQPSRLSIFPIGQEEQTAPAHRRKRHAGLHLQLRRRSTDVRRSQPKRGRDERLPNVDDEGHRCRHQARNAGYRLSSVRGRRRGRRCRSSPHGAEGLSSSGGDFDA